MPSPCGTESMHSVGVREQNSEHRPCSPLSTYNSVTSTVKRPIAGMLLNRLLVLWHGEGMRLATILLLITVLPFLCVGQTLHHPTRHPPEAQWLFSYVNCVHLMNLQL